MSRPLLAQLQQLQPPRPAALVGGFAAAGLGLAVYARFLTSTAHAESHEPKKIFPGGPSIVSLPLESSEVVTKDVKRLRFRLPEPDAISGLPLTGALLAFAWPKGCLLPAVRPYTPTSPSDEPGIVEFLIKRYPAGKMSPHLHALLPGETLRFLVAIKGFAWQPNQFNHVTLIAGGQGITPMYQLVQGIMSNPDDKTRVTLVYGANTDADLLLKPEFDRFAREFPDRFRAEYVVARPAQGSPHRAGHVTAELLADVARKDGGAGVGKSEKVFVCGPPAMEKALTGSMFQSGILRELGWDKKGIHKF